MEDAGVPTYDELVVVANEDSLERDGGKIRAFIGALSRGTEDLHRNPKAGIEGLLRANRDLDPRLQRAAVAVTMPLFLPPRGKPFGWQDPTEWKEFAAWMRDRKLLENPPDTSAALTNEMLPGTGL
jgi:putative hydroxymethylpyrimidine transport system substrate-binding protein